MGRKKTYAVHAVEPSPGDARVPNPLRIFRWGYEGWGNATRQLVRAIDLVEAAKGFAPPVFVDVRLQRSVRAVGFRAGAFERLLGHERYRWLPSLGNPILRDSRASRRVKRPESAHRLLDLALDTARLQRRVIFFCSCHALAWWCHRHDVAKELLKVAGRRGYDIVVEGWPGGQPARSSLSLQVPTATVQAVRSGRKTVPLSRSVPLPTFGGLPWGTIVELHAGDERQMCSVGPAAFRRGRWVLPLFPEDQPFDRSRMQIRSTVARARRKAKLEPTRSRVTSS